MVRKAPRWRVKRRVEHGFVNTDTAHPLQRRRDAHRTQRNGTGKTERQYSDILCSHQAVLAATPSKTRVTLGKSLAEQGTVSEAREERMQRRRDGKAATRRQQSQAHPAARQRLWIGTAPGQRSTHTAPHYLRSERVRRMLIHALLALASCACPCRLRVDSSRKASSDRKLPFN